MQLWSGNENALKMASFHTNKSRVISFHNAFHGRTSAAVATTDNKKLLRLSMRSK
jgi:acetylornithine aminotransferase